MAVMWRSVRIAWWRCGVAEGGSPFGDRAVAGHQHRAALVAPARQLEEQVGGVGLEQQVGQLVDDQQLEAW